MAASQLAVDQLDFDGAARSSRSFADVPGIIRELCLSSALVHYICSLEMFGSLANRLPINSTHFVRKVTLKLISHVYNSCSAEEINSIEHEIVGRDKS